MSTAPATALPSTAIPTRDCTAAAARELAAGGSEGCGGRAAAARAANGLHVAQPALDKLSRAVERVDEDGDVGHRYGPLARRVRAQVCTQHRRRLAGHALFCGGSVVLFTNDEEARPRRAKGRDDGLLRGEVRLGQHSVPELFARL